MYRAVKIVSILVIVISVTGCATSRKRSEAEKPASTATVNYNMILEEVKANNITDKGFIIRKGRIELEGTEYDGTYSFNAKVNNEGNLSASVRGPFGIEVIRLIISGEDICAIDRLDRTVYVGRKDEVLKKKGIPKDFLKAFFGDVNEQTYKISDSIIGTMLVLIEEGYGFSKETYICTDEMKICKERYRSDVSKSDLLLSFNEFVLSGETKYPSEIEISENLRNVMIKIFIDDILIGYSEEIPFTVPQYKRQPFL